MIDMGVAADLPDHSDLVRANIRRGTGNAAREPAMSPEEAAAALTRGCDLAVEAIRGGADSIAIGEMGIGNTASAALLLHRLAPAALDLCIGLGAGQDDEGLARKRAALERAAAAGVVPEGSWRTACSPFLRHSRLRTR